MKRKLLILLLIVIAITGIAIYNKRDMFRQEDTISITGTDERVANGLKIYAAFDKPRSAEFKNGSWYGENAAPLQLIVDGKNTFSFPKQYTHADFYITLGDTLFNSIRMEKESKSFGIDYQFQVTQRDTTYLIAGAAIHHGSKRTHFNNWRLDRIYSGKIKISEMDSGGIKFENGE